RSCGLAQRLRAAAAEHTPILGVCGGTQALGISINDPTGIESSATGLGLLQVTTTLEPDKRVRRSSVRFGDLETPWNWLANRHVSGYEIRLGHSTGTATEVATPTGLAFAHQNILGVYIHGLFEDHQTPQAFTRHHTEPLDQTFNGLAD